MFEIKQFQNIIGVYGIKDKIMSAVLLEEMKNESELRLIYRLDLQNKLQLICRISRESNYSKELIEQQSCFSEKLRAYGLPVAQKYKLFGTNEFSFALGTDGCIVTLERYMGINVETVELQSFYKIGVFLGKIHFFSECNKFHIAPSALVRSITEGRATFERILINNDFFLKNRHDVKILCMLHDSLVVQLKKNLYKLPHGAVHGDLGILNNLVTAEGKIYIIDFNLSGDEPFLCDLLSCFYSSVHKYTWREKLSGINEQQAFSQYMLGYFSQRLLTNIEKQFFSQVAALFDGLYYCKAIIEEYEYTNNTKVFERFKIAINKFSQPNLLPLITV